jgi:hypothetical protein
MYITKSDYKSRISTDLLDTIISEGESNGDDVLQIVSHIAEDTISTRAGVLYNLSNEWNKTATERNGLIFSWALSISTYWMYQRIDDEDVPAKVIKNYEDTLDALELVSNGKHPLNLPPNTSTPEGSNGGDELPVIDGSGLRRIGSRTPRSHSI